jgi:hypothetical protein
MAAAVKGEKALLGVKRSTKVTEYTSGAPVAPASGCLAVYADMGDGDEHRSLEILTKLQNLSDRARESDYLKPTNTTLYFRVPLDGSKHSIESTTDSTDIVQGDVAIGIHASLRSGEGGSILFDSCFKQIFDNMFESYGMIDPTPEIDNNLGGTVLEGGTLAITSTMLKVVDGSSYPEELEFSVTAGPANGQLEFSTDPGTGITAFTQADINANILRYVHDGTDTITGDFTFSVTNGVNTLAAQTFAITVTPVVD